MAAEYDEQGNPVTTHSAATEYDEQGNPVLAPHGPGKGGNMPSGTASAQAPNPADLPPMGRFAGGVDQILNLGGNRPDQKLQGVHNAFVGGAEMAAPLALPALVASPVATLSAAALGAGGKLAGTAIPAAMGVSPEASEVIGDTASIPSAMLGGAAGESVAPAISRFVSRGVPSWATDAVGILHPHAAFMMRSAGRIADMLKSGDAPFEPFRPNPAIAAKMRFGGPVDMSGGRAYSGVGMSGAPEPIAPVPFQPSKPNPNIAAKMRFGGPVDNSGTAAYPGVGMSGAPPAPAPKVPFVPNKVNPAIARNLRFTPSPEPGSSATAGSRVPFPPRQAMAILPEPLTSPSPAVPATTQPTAPGTAPDYSPITRQYKTSPSKAKFGANGKRIF